MLFLLAWLNLGFMNTAVAVDQLDKPVIQSSCMMLYVSSIIPNDLPKNFAPIESLPQKIYTTSTETRSTKAFAFANQAWKKHGEMEAAWSAVDELADGNFNTVSAATIAKLKTVQTYSETIQNSYALFDKSHAAPKAWETFSTRLHRLNSAIASGSVKDIMASAETLGDAFGKLPEYKMLEKLHPENAAGFKAYLGKNVQEMRSLLAKDSLDLSESLSLRQKTQKLTTYFQAQLAMDPTPEGQRIVEFLKTTSDEIASPTFSSAKTKNDLTQFLSRLDLDPPARRTFQRPRGRPYENN